MLPKRALCIVAWCVAACGNSPSGGEPYVRDSSQAEMYRTHILENSNLKATSLEDIEFDPITKKITFFHNKNQSKKAKNISNQEYYENYKVGDVIAAAPSSKMTYGLLAKISSIKQTDQLTEISTVPATIEEAIRGSNIPEGRYTVTADATPEAGYRYLYNPSFINLKELDDNPVRLPTDLYMLASNQAIGQAISWYYQLGDKEICLANKTISDANGATVSVKACVAPSIRQELDADIIIKRYKSVPYPSLQSFKTSNTLKVTGYAHLESDKAWTASFVNVKLATIMLGTGVAHIGPIPVSYTPVIDIFFRLDGSVGGKISCVVSGGVEGVIGAAYQKGAGWTRIGETRYIKPQVNFDSPLDLLTGSFKANLSASVVGLGAGIYLYNSVGPYGSLSANLGLSYSSPNTFISVDGAVVASLDIDASKIASELSFNLRRWVLWKAPIVKISLL